MNSNQPPLDYAPFDEPYHRTPPVNAGLTAAFWAVLVGLACYGAWALVWF